MGTGWGQDENYNTHGISELRHPVYRVGTGWVQDGGILPTI
jgi:hypothetical protein